VARLASGLRANRGASLRRTGRCRDVVRRADGSFGERTRLGDRAWVQREARALAARTFVVLAIPCGSGAAEGPAARTAASRALDRSVAHRSKRRINDEETRIEGAGGTSRPSWDL
jgi:hypothetical protein